MQKVNAIIVDDEESARDVLENLLKRFCPKVEIIEKCENVPNAVEAVKKYQPHIVFLDIEMPNYAGYEIVDFFEEVDFQIIFVTAYDHYALRAFEVAAVDYLLKPINIDRLKLAVERASNRVELDKNKARMRVLSQSLQNKTLTNLIVTERGNQYIVPISSIIAIEAQESYCAIYTAAKKYMMSNNLKHFEELFKDSANLFRVHKSWIISKLHIQHYSRAELKIKLAEGITAKLSKYRKAEFEAAMLS